MSTVVSLQMIWGMLCRLVEVVFQDESLTSVQAEAMLRRDKKHFKEQMLRDGTLDSQAAVVILTDYLGGVK